MPKIEEILKKININCPILPDEPMSRHTAFQIGGPADALIIPGNTEELSRVYSFIHEQGIPCFILGGGANILVSDKGIRGVVIDLSCLKGFKKEEDNTISACAGTPITEVCEYALELGLSGMEFLYSMPGSVGGSICMNARCYSKSVSDILCGVEYLYENGSTKFIEPEPGDFAYKKSPFQKMKGIILKGIFSLKCGNKERIKKEMYSNEADRVSKGHFLFPCAGSVFKNNRSFGRPAGMIIDSLGFRGLRLGGAQVSKNHANIIVNTGRAKAVDVLEIIKSIEDKVFKHFGYRLEREILLIGEW